MHNVAVLFRARHQFDPFINETMQRSEFHHKFGTPGPVILPVIHVVDEARTAANIDHVVKAGLKGCFLINHDFGIEPFLPIITAIRGRYPDLWIGVNFLAVTGLDAFPIGVVAQAEIRVAAAADPMKTRRVCFILHVSLWQLRWLERSCGKPDQ